MWERKILKLETVSEKVVLAVIPFVILAIIFVGISTYRIAKQEFLTHISNSNFLVPVKLLVIAVVLLTISLTILVVFLVIQEILKPVKILVKATDLIKQGNLGTEINIKTNDEIGRLATHFKELSGQLKIFSDELRQKINHLAALREVSEASSKRLDEEKTLRITLSAAIRGLGFERGILYLVNEEEKVIEGKFSVGMTDFVSEQQIQKRRLPLNSDDILGDVVLYNQAYNIVDPARDHRCNKQFMSETKTKAFCLVPIRTSDKIIGIFSVDNYFSQREITNEQVANLATFANTAGLAIENVRLYNELQTKYEELKILNKMKANFIANVTHELRTPLTPVKGYVDALLEETLGKISSEQRKCLTIVKENLDTTIKRVNTMIDFAQSEQKELQSEFEPFDLVQILNLCASKIEEQAKEKGLKFYRFLPAELSPVTGDPEQIEKVVNSLLHNAVKFTSEGYIALKVATEEGKVLVEISDTGIGIPGEEIDKIFEKFYQIDATAARRHGGMGIGLSLVKNILEAHESKVEVKSKVGEGSTFSFTLSLAANPPAGESL